MPINFKNLQELINDQVVAIQAESSSPIAFNTGTVELAQVQANAAMGIWLEALANKVLAMARAQTSEGIDLDTWMAQFKLTRLPGVASSGNVQFSRFTSGSTINIPINTQVKTTNSELTFNVVADTTNPDYNPTLQAYVMQSTAVSLNAKVECTTVGTSGNVGANEITLISSPIPGIDNVDNSSPFTNGKDQESDSDFRARFVLYINSRSRAVLLAYANVIANIPEITRYNVVENKNFSGATQLGYVYTVVDDGTGAVPPNILSQVLVGIENVRGLAIQNDVYQALTTLCNISMNLLINNIQSQAQITAIVTTAIGDYINKFPFETNLIFTRLYEIIYDSSPNILKVDNLLLNSGTIDLTGSSNTVFLLGTLNIGYL